MSVSSPGNIQTNIPEMICNGNILDISQIKKFYNIR